MATLLDLGILSAVQVVFPFLLVFVFVWAGLTRFFPPFKEKPAWGVTAALVLAFMAILSPITVKAINLMSPWFVLLMVFGMLGILAYQAMGVKDETIFKIMTDSEYSSDFAVWMLALILLIGIGSVLSVITEQSGGVPGPGVPGDTTGAKVVYTQNQEGGQSGAFWNTVFHPKVLGMALILLIAATAISRLSHPEGK